MENYKPCHVDLSVDYAALKADNAALRKRLARLVESAEGNACNEAQKRLDALFLEAFSTNHPAMTDWVFVKFYLKHVGKAIAAAKEAE